MSLDTRIQARVAALVKRVGKLITYRRVTRSAGPNPEENPASASALLVVGLTAIGAGTISLDAASVTGQLIAGDTFVVAGNAQVYTVTGGPHVAVANAFAGVTFTPVLVAAAADNAAVTVTWSGETTLYARISGFPLRMIDGEMIRAEDLQVIIPKVTLPVTPNTGDLLLIDGQTRLIVAASPAYVATEPGMWSLQAR